MSRFYQTAQSRFVDNNIYLPPWELAQSVILNKEKEVDNALGNAALIGDSMATVNFLNFADDKDTVANARKKYEDQILAHTEAIKGDPLNYEKYMKDVDKTRRDMLSDRTTGDLFQVEQRYAAYNKWVEENKDMKEKEPDLYNEMHNKLYKDMVEGVGQDPTTKFNNRQIVGRPDISAKFNDVFLKLQNDAEEQTDGRWLYKNEYLSKDKLAQMAWNMVQLDPNTRGYLDQMGNFLGKEGYVGEENMPGFVLVDKEGEQVTFEEVKEMTDDELKKRGIKQVINNKNPFANDLHLASGYANQQQSMKEDPYGRSSQDYQEAYSLQQLQDANAADRLKLKFQYDYKLAKAKGDIEEQGNILTATSPKYVATVEEIETMGKQYITLASKAAAGEKFDSKTEIEYARLQSMFDNLDSEHGMSIIRAFGEDPTKLSEQQRKTRVAVLLQEMNKYRADNNYGRVEMKEDRPGVNHKVYNYDYNKKIGKAIENLEEQNGDYAKMLAESMVVRRGFMPVNGRSAYGKKGMNLVNRLLLEAGEPSLHAIGMELHDIDGNVRGKTRIDVDVSRGVGSASANPLKDIMNALQVTDVKDLEGIVDLKWRYVGQETIVDVIPSNMEALDAAGIDIGDGFFPREGFTMKYSGVINNFFEGEDLSDPEVFNLYKQSDSYLSAAADKVDMTIAQLRSGNGEDVKPFNMVGIPGKWFKIETAEGGKYRLLESTNEDRGRHMNWTPTKVDMQGTPTTFTTPSPEAIMLYLRDRGAGLLGN